MYETASRVYNETPMRITVLFDRAEPPRDQDYTDELKAPEAPEFEVAVALRALGHDVMLLGFHNDVTTIIGGLRAQEPELVFNAVEAFGGDFRKDAYVAALLEMLGYPYTGSGPEGLMLGRDKSQSKKLLAYHKVHVPAFKVFPRRTRARKASPLKFPVFVKPLDQDGSFAIAQSSVAENDGELTERLGYIHKKLEHDAIVEEHVVGRELYVGVLGNARPRALPAIEMKFTNPAPGQWKIATHRAKWNEAYRKERGIVNEPARDLDAASVERLQRAALAAYRTLHIRDYGRADFRMKEEGTVYLIEMNPNPFLRQGDDFANAAKEAGIEYNELIATIVEEARKRTRAST